jgi:hypothetical protein
MQADAAFRQTFEKNSTRGFSRRPALTRRGLVLGAGTLVAKFDGKGRLAEGGEERALTLLTVACGHETPRGMLDSLRRVAKQWQGGDKCLAAIHLAQIGLPDIGEDAAYRLSLAAELIDAGVAPSELARELGFDPPAGFLKYDPNEPRVPAGNGRASGDWTPSGDAAGSTLIEGRLAGTNAGGLNIVPDLPKDAVVVTRPDGTTIEDPKSPTKKLMAPPQANFQEVYAAGKQISDLTPLQQFGPARIALHQFGTYDFQRDEATNNFFDAYIHASNYAIGVYMAGAGYGLSNTLIIARGYALLFSSNAITDKTHSRGGLLRCPR